MKLCAHSVILGLVIICMYQSGSPYLADSRVQRGSEVEEYAIYDAVIKKLYIDDVPEKKRFDLLVIQERTSLQDRVAEDLDRALRVLKTSLGRNTLDDLKTKNKESQKLSSLLSNQIGYVIVAKEELKNSFDDSPIQAWRRFYQKYPNSSGLIGFSKAGFNKEVNQALVYVERNCGPNCADGRIVLLTKVNDHWIVLETVIIWIV